MHLLQSNMQPPIYWYWIFTNGKIWFVSLPNINLESIFSYLMKYQRLWKWSPGHTGRGIVADCWQNNRNRNRDDCPNWIHHEHYCNTRNETCQCRLPREIFKSWSKIWSRCPVQSQTGQVTRGIGHQKEYGHYRSNFVNLTNQKDNLYQKPRDQDGNIWITILVCFLCQSQHGTKHSITWHCI